MIQQQSSVALRPTEDGHDGCGLRAVERADPRRVWLVSAHLVPPDYFTHSLQTHWEMVAYHPFLQAAVWQYERPRQ